MNSFTDWQILDARSIWMKEFASALQSRVATTAWIPEMRWTGHWRRKEKTQAFNDPQLQATTFPLQRGYARTPIKRWLPFSEQLWRKLQTHTQTESCSVLVCTTPFYAPLALHWRGPVIYYVTDLTKKYEGSNERQVINCDKQLCTIASLVCPNSMRIADYLVKEAGCSLHKLQIVPNATRRSNILANWRCTSFSRPSELQDVERPVVGVIGNLAGNLDWCLLRAVIERTPFVAWVFVGPTSMTINNHEQSEARRWAMDHSCFIGPKPYGELQSYARAFDVAALPYLKTEPTYSGSSTRFYEHLAACRPMIGTRGFAELLEKQPLIRLADTADEWVDALFQLKRDRFRDGLEQKRWQASLSSTWDDRVESMLTALSNRQTGTRDKMSAQSFA